ncbi:glycosyltransferase [Mycobacterium sp.]|uniref:glycosyltransferase n=1 Tax=Mycobacterium sp. TaxID=1785 RepID=UPI002DA38B18|nr:glycosyltransferase [Mycobacterium sp.]
MKTTMRVCLVRQYYVPLDTRVLREAEALVDSGHEVDLVCLRDKGEPSRERRGALHIYRLPLSRKRGGSTLWPLAEYVFFFCAATVLVNLLHLRRRYAVVQANSVPDFLIFVAAIPRLLGARAVLDLHEPMPEFYASKFGSGPDHPGVRLMAFIERISIRFADEAITVTDPMRDRFVARGADPGKITVVLNGADEKVFDPSRCSPATSDGEFRLVCHGSIEERYGLDTVIRAVALLADELPALRLRIYGRGTYKQELERLVADLGVGDRVWFSEGFVPIDELVQALAEADAGVVAMKQDAFRDLTLANKMYDFITMRKPQLVSRTRSVEVYFDETAFGLFRSDDPMDLARAIREVVADPQRRAVMVDSAAKQGDAHRWPLTAPRYVGVIEHAAGLGRHSRRGTAANGGAQNKQHWDRVGAAYSRSWEPAAKRVMSDLELGFVEGHVPRRPGLAVMDVGIGNGRIIERLLSRDEVAALDGLDIAPQMVDVCRMNVGANPKVRGLHVCDVSAEPIPVQGELDFVSCIRVLKYSRNWADVVAKLAAKLAPGGALVFTMPNRCSLTRLSRAYAVEYHLSTEAELRCVVEAASCELLEISGFAKLPDLLYRTASGPASARAVLGVERRLDAAMGRARFARELFVAARRR